MKDVQLFQQQMARLCVVYGRTLDVVLSDAWWEACATLSDDQFTTGVALVLQESSRFPTPALVRAAAYAATETAHERSIGDDRALAPGPILDARRAEGRKYAAASLVESGLVTPLYTCLVCRDRRFVNVAVDVGTPFFGRAIPCPHCNGEAYDRWVEAHGRPPDMPQWAR